MKEIIFFFTWSTGNDIWRKNRTQEPSISGNFSNTVSLKVK